MKMKIQVILIAVISFLSATPVTSIEGSKPLSVLYPLKVSSNQRYLVDQDDKPFFMHGDTPWSLFLKLSIPDVEIFLENRRQKGFNTLNVMMLSYDEGTSGSHSWASDYEGQLPFLKNLSGEVWDGSKNSLPDFETPNEAYFKWCDKIIDMAASSGLNLNISVAWTGYAGGSWYNIIMKNSLEKCYSYGRYLGNRYKNKPNIVWIMQGDKDPTDEITREIEIARGIQSADPNHLITAHCVRNSSAADFYGTQSWLSLNSTYARPTTIVKEALGDYYRSLVKPSFLIEGWYEGEHDMTPLDLRRQSYWAALCGMTGQIFGNNPIYLMGSGWQTAMESRCSVEQSYFKKLIDSRAWHTLVPDRDKLVVTNGGGEYPSTITAAGNGESVIVYLPGGSENPKVDMSKISGGKVKCWWYNPRTGEHTLIGTFLNTGTRSFTSPDTTDWVLVLDDATKDFPAPGTAHATAL